MEKLQVQQEGLKRFCKEIPSFGGVEVGYEEDGNRHYVVIRSPFPKDIFIKTYGVAPKPDTLSALADGVAKTICDTNTKIAFRKFANLLIEKVEKK